MKLPVLTLALLLTSVALASDTEATDGNDAAQTPKAQALLKLTTKTFQNVRETSPYLLVFFHENECTYCEKMLKILEDLRVEFAEKHPTVRFATVDVEDNETVKEDEGIIKTPELRLYMDGDTFALYIDAMAKEKISAWIDRLFEEDATARQIKTERDYQTYKTTPVSAFFSVPEITERNRKYVNNLARIFPKVPFFWAETHSKFDDRIVPDEEERYFFHFKFKRNFDDGDKEYKAVEGFRPESIIRLLNRLSKPAVEPLTGETLNNILSEGLRAVVVFDRTLNTPLMNRFEFAALKSNDTCVFIKSTIDDSNAQILARKLGVEEAEFPAMRAMVTENGQLKKYKFDGEFTQRKIFNFLYDFEHNDLKEYQKSGKYVNNYGREFHKYNRNQFLKVIGKGKVDVFVGFIGKWCPDCGAVQTVLVDINKKMTKDRDSIVLAEVDTDENDIDSVLKSQLPSIQLYKKNQPKMPILYEGKFSADAVIRWLEKELGRRFTRDDDGEDEEEDYEEEIPAAEGLEADLDDLGNRDDDI
jgi:thioredoxin-like negative regulator of GroEL